MIYESSTCWLRVSEGRQHTGWQDRADDDKTGAGMRQPWGGKGTKYTRYVPGPDVQTFPRVRRVSGDGLDGYGEGLDCHFPVGPERGVCSWFSEVSDRLISSVCV